MCGIFGYSFKHGKLSAARRAVLATNLARYNDDRGGDSWGVVGINADGHHIAKGLGDLSDSAYELCEYQTLFAHTRAASVGEVNLKNAHPFKVGRIIGAHNGYVYNHEELAVQYKRNFSVDSMHIFAHINENRKFDEIVARGAVEWIHTDDPKTIYLSKLFNGELAAYGIGTEDNVQGVVWSSSYKHLLKALFCTGISDHFRYEVRRGRVYSVNNGMFRILRDMRLEVTEPDFKKPDDEGIHYSPLADGASLCGATNILGWTRERGTTDCVNCKLLLRAGAGTGEAQPSDEAGAAKFRGNTSIVPIHERVDDVALWKLVYGTRAEV